MGRVTGPTALPKPRAAAVSALLAAIVLATPMSRAQDDPLKFVVLETDDDANCVRWEGKLVLVRNTHPTRSVRVWLERDHMGKHTGDRSRSELAPNAEPEKLGCSRTQYGTQGWRVVRAEFVD